MPCDYSKYGPEFPAISQHVRFERAGNKCEWCGVPNYEEGYWVWDRNDNLPEGLARRVTIYKDGSEKIWRFYNYQMISDYLDHDGIELLDDIPIDKKMSKVVLTVSHLNHDVTDHRLENLKAACQWCHLNWDRKDNARRRMYGPTGQHRNQIVIQL